MALISRNFSDIITFTRASSGTFVGANGLLQTAGNNVPRFEYDPITLAARGLLVEESRTNLLTYSEQFDNAAWTKQANCSVTGVNAGIAPDGTLTADEVTFTATTNDGIFQGVSVAASTTYTASFWVKGTGSQVVQIGCQPPAGAVFTQVTLNGSWQRVSATATTTVAGTLNVSVDLVSGTTPAVVHVCGAQLEAGAFATSYIPTVASAVTRAADTASVNTLSPWFNATEGTIFLDVGAAQGTFPQAFEFRRDGNNYLKLGKEFNTSAPSTNYQLTNLFAGPNNVELGSQQASGRFAFGYQTNNSALSANGGAVLTDASCQFAAWTSMHLGWSLANGGRQANTHIRRLSYYPRRLSNAELQALTA
jgi:hypothetical protein